MKPESVVRKDDLLKSIFGDDDVGPSEGCNPVIHEDASDISPVASEAEDEEDGGVDTIFGNKSHRGERTPRSDHEIRDEVNTFWHAWSLQLSKIGNVLRSSNLPFTSLEC